MRRRHEYVGSVTSNDEGEIFKLDLITKCIQGLKVGKAACLDEVEPEHIVYAHPVVQSMLATLFNSILYYGYVPRDFSSGIIIPIIKDKYSDKTLPVAIIVGLLLVLILLNCLKCAF